VTKSDQKAVQPSKNNIDIDDKKSHFMSQLMEERRKRDVEIAGLMDALRKIGYFQSFQTTEKHTLSSDYLQETRSRKIKHRRKAAYRCIKKYCKSIKQYKKERLRRKLCWLLSGKHTYKEIGEMLGISKRTVIRDINKIRPYYYRQSRAYFRRIHAERQREIQEKLVSMSIFEQYTYLTELIATQRDLYKVRQYRSHFTILTLDMTKADSYGIPKLSITQKGKILAYPHKVRVQFIGSYEGRNFLADLGGYTVTQTTVRGW